MGERKNPAGIIAAAFMGALAGATATILLNEDTRKKARQQLDKAAKTGKSEAKRLKKEAKSWKGKLAKQLAKTDKKITG